MDIEDLTDRIKTTHPKLYVTEVTDNNMRFKPEDDLGYVEYKRTLVDCGTIKSQKYATQMRWRISENVKNQFAIYYIGVDDDGTIVGLNNNEAMVCVNRFVSIANSINASICGVRIIHVDSQLILRINVKIKKNINNCLFEFGDKF